ncbi:MAG: UDP-galactopyranose mutase [Actinomycetota bacterium]
MARLGDTFDWLVVGAGLTGATLAERIASETGARVLVVDRRNHIGGNVHDAFDEHGVLVHQYGPHIFHTSSLRVWTYLSRFTGWIPYEHRVLASIDGRLVPVPFNLTTLEQLVGGARAEALEDQLVTTYGLESKVPVLKLLESGDPSLRALAELVYEKVFLGYTTKQWGLRPEELDRSVTGRVPIFVSRDDRYFQDRFQAIPALGYTEMVRRMLDHPGITVSLGTDYREAVDAVRWDRMVYTGPIDSFFDGAHGPLPYRSLRFEHESLPVEQFQPVAQVNHPNDHAYTRIVEHKHFTGVSLPSTTITYEHPEPHVAGQNEPYYPIPREENRARYDRYAADAAALAPRVLFVGRLAHYRYYDMDQAVSHALLAFRNDVLGHRQLASPTYLGR